MINRVQFFLQWMILIICTFSVQAQTPVQVGNTFEELFLSKQVALLEDPSNKLSIKEVVKLPFKSHTNVSINLGFTNSFYWVKFRLFNPDTVKKELILEVENPHINKLQLYALSQGQMQVSMLTGDHFPFAQRPIKYTHFLLPIQLKPHQTIDYYLWVDKHGEQLQIPLRLWNKETFSTNSYKLFLFVGCMLGISSLYCIISLLIYLFFRQKLTFYYWLYTAGIWLFLVAHAGLGFQLLWTQSTWWASAARPTTAMLLYIFSLLFTRRFFDLSHTHRFFNLFTKALIAMFLLLLLILWLQNPILGIFKEYWYNPIYYDGTWLLLFMKAVNLVCFIFLVTMPIIGIHYYVRYRKPESLWFSAGNSMLLLGGLTIIFVFAGYLPDNYITQNIPLLTNAIETVILSFLLANRFRNIHQQNAQISAELAEQRQRNALQLLEGQSIERKRLSQELHDGISLALANIRLRLSIVAEKLNGQGKEVQALVEDLGEVGQDVRQFSHALSPVLLERHGLVEAIEDLAFRTQSAHPKLKIRFDHDSFSGQSIHSLIQQSLYQITLELVNNIAKHAEATQARLRLTENSNEILLEVQDNGMGYQPDNEAQGIGLQNIRSRVELFNGIFEGVRLEQGMLHRIRIPIQTNLFS